MAQPEFIKVRIGPVGQNALKVTWEHRGGNFPPYLIDRDLLMRQAEEVRRELKRLAADAVQRGPGSYGSALKSLAEKGVLLGQALFTPIEQSAWPSRVRRYLDGLNGDHKMMFVLDERIQIPWGLVFDGELSEISGRPGDYEISTFRDFWCVKYSLAGMYHRIPPDVLAGDRGGKSTLLQVVHQSALEMARSELDPDEKQTLDRLQSIFDHEASSSSEFFEKWSSMMGRSAVLFFYCHASGTDLDLGDGDRLTIDDMRLQLTNYGEPQTDLVALVLINGCSTATGSSGGGFLEATGSPPFCGFVGTEADIPDSFALRFGYSLLREIIVSDEPLLRIMDRLRAQHWPLSLFYSLYCNPYYTCECQLDTAEDIPEFVTQNFSAKNLGRSLLTRGIED